MEIKVEVIEDEKKQISTDFIHDYKNQMYNQTQDESKAGVRVISEDKDNPSNNSYKIGSKMTF